MRFLLPCLVLLTCVCAIFDLDRSSAVKGILTDKAREKTTTRKRPRRKKLDHKSLLERFNLTTTADAGAMGPGYPLAAAGGFLGALCVLLC